MNIQFAYRMISAISLCVCALQAEDADSAKRKDAMELIRLTTLQPEGLDVLLPSAVAFAIANAPGAKISEEEAARLAREVILSDAFLEKFTPPFEEIFSHEEIRDLIAMYRSDVMGKFYRNYGKTCYPILPSITAVVQEIVQKRCDASALADHVLSITAETYSRDVKESDLPVVLDVYSTYCPPCRRVAPIVAALSGELQGKVRFAKVNIDEHPSIAKELGIFSVPTIVFFNRGEIVDRQVGAIGREELMAKIEKAFGSAAK